MSTYYQNMSAKDLLDKDYKIDNKKVIEKEIECLEKVDCIISNSDLTYKLFKKIYLNNENIKKLLKYNIDTTIYLGEKSTNNEKKYDILVCCSNFYRKDKNNYFLKNILLNERIQKYSKYILGSNNINFNDLSNVKISNLVSHKECISIMKDCKILLFPSLFDSNPNTVREAYFNECLPIITENIGMSELYPDFLICKNFNEEEWINKIIFNLENYNFIKNVKINYKNIFIDKLIDIEFLQSNLI